MKNHSFLRLGGLTGVICHWLACTALGAPPDPPEFEGPQRLTNGEIRLRLWTASSVTCRVDVSSDLAVWTPLVSVAGASPAAHDDSGAPFLAQRFYRALVTNVITGDYLATTNDPVLIRPGKHAGFMMSWGNRTIYVDPTNSIASLPKGGLILVTHQHADHFNNTTIAAVIAASSSVIICPPAVYTSLSASLKPLAFSMTSSGATNWVWEGAPIAVQALPMYNLANTPHSTNSNPGNGYVLTLGGRRIYIAGDTEDTPEMRALRDIDVAFLPMNRPFTMTVSQAVAAVRAFRPKVVYPYHYRNQDLTYADRESFKREVMADPGIEVRLRPWY